MQLADNGNDSHLWVHAPTCTIRQQLVLYATFQSNLPPTHIPPSMSGCIVLSPVINYSPPILYFGLTRQCREPTLYIGHVGHLTGNGAYLGVT